MFKILFRSLGTQICPVNVGDGAAGREARGVLKGVTLLK